MEPLCKDIIHFALNVGISLIPSSGRKSHHLCVHNVVGKLHQAANPNSVLIVEPSWGLVSSSHFPFLKLCCIKGSSLASYPNMIESSPN